MRDPAYYLQLAIDLAVDNALRNRGGPYGAVIIKKGAIIARGSNRVTADQDPTAHAEIMAIRQACRTLNDFQLHDCILYSNCEPCPMCLGAIYWARLDRVYYAASRRDAAQAGFDDAYIYQELALPPHERHIPMRQLELAEAQLPFQTWLEQSARIPY